MSPERSERPPCMGLLKAYVFVTMNGLYKGVDDDISWHQHGPEETAYSVASLAERDVLLFGRRTYEHMASFWPTAGAAQQLPEVADGMNRADRIVFSRQRFTPGWDGTRCVTGDVSSEVRRLKQADRDMTILGSGSIVSLLAERGLVDQLQIMSIPSPSAGAGRSSTASRGGCCCSWSTTGCSAAGRCCSPTSRAADWSRWSRSNRVDSGRGAGMSRRAGWPVRRGAPHRWRRRSLRSGQRTSATRSARRPTETRVAGLVHTQ